MTVAKSTTKKRSTRREFLNQSARSTVAIGVGLATAGSWSKVLGANERIRLGVIGPGVRGQSVMGQFQKNPEVEVVALCDVYEDNLKKAQNLAGGKAKEFSDHRNLLEQKDIDAVLIATQNHWHASIAIDPCNSGKDFYIEKPLTFSIAAVNGDRGMPMIWSRNQYGIDIFLLQQISV